MNRVKPESLLIEVSHRGVSAVTIRVSPERRDSGIALLEKAMHSIAQLDKDLRAKGKDGHAGDVR